MKKNIVEKSLNEILNFIENELRNTEHPIFVDISKKILDVYGIDIYPARVAQLCRKINEEKGLNKTFSDRKHSISQKKREMRELRKEADSIITDEEVYLCRIRGYSYGVMSRIYFELTGKLLEYDYFSSKFIRYCHEHNISVAQNRLSKNNPSAFDNITDEDLAKHSEFFKKIYSEAGIRNTKEQRRKAACEVKDPYRKLHEEMQKTASISKDFDNR